MANAILYDRGDGLIYDSDQNITWLQDANYAKTSGYDSDGAMTWSAAKTWAENLVYKGYDDWRLPTTVDGLRVIGNDGTTTAGCNITTSEMGYMYYVNLGNLGLNDTSGNPQPGFGLNNTGPFINLKAGYYQSGSEYGLDASQAWYFAFNSGYQDTSATSGVKSAWAVRDGDVGGETHSVIVPGIMLLLGLD